MPENLPEAAIMAGAGVAMVFVALSILMLAIVLLSRLGPDAGKKAAPGETQVAGPTRETIAAMAVAMALATEERRTASPLRPASPPVPQPEVSPWAISGRERLVRSRTNTGHRWGRSSR
jgi:Na+-transporting methylmalonyl-CoA/oxaloacetate decarboxylase gamma subunit